MADPITDTIGLKAGDVLLVARELKDKQTGQPFWWRSFRAVLEVSGKRSLVVLTLKLNPDLEKDVWNIDLSSDERQVVTVVAKDQWPQGVNAMWMKHVHTGLIKLAAD